MANTFAVFEDDKVSKSISLCATIDDSIEAGRVTQITIVDDFTNKVLSYTLNEKETKELISALQARIDGHITAFGGTFNQ